MDAADAERDDRLHPGALRQGSGSILADALRFVALARLSINCCETLATLYTCFILDLAGQVRSQFNWGDLPQTLAEAIHLALDFEATAPPEPAPLWRVVPRESSLVRLDPISSGPRHQFSAPSQIPSPPSRVGCITLVQDPGPGPAHILSSEPVLSPAPVLSPRIPRGCPRRRGSRRHRRDHPGVDGGLILDPSIFADHAPGYFLTTSPDRCLGTSPGSSSLGQSPGLSQLPNLPQLQSVLLLLSGPSLLCGLCPGPSLLCGLRSGPSLLCGLCPSPSLLCGLRPGPSLLCRLRPSPSLPCGLRPGPSLLCGLPSTLGLPPLLVCVCMFCPYEPKP